MYRLLLAFYLNAVGLQVYLGIQWHQWKLFKHESATRLSNGQQERFKTQSGP